MEIRVAPTTELLTFTLAPTLPRTCSESRATPETPELVRVRFTVRVRLRVGVRVSLSYPNPTLTLPSPYPNPTLTLP